jgi:signal transduction histidine kinase/ActR/RegA family two-component response regulator
MSPPAGLPDIAAYELLDLPVLLVDGDGRALACNRAFSRFTGHAEQAHWQGRHIDELLCSAATDPALRLWALKRLRTGEGFEPVAFTGQDAQGRPLHAELGLRVASGGAVVTLRPASVQHQLAEDHRRLAELLDLAQDFGRVGVWERDVRTMQGRWDRHAWQLWDLPPQEGAPPFEQVLQGVVPEEREAFARLYQGSIKRCGTYSMRLRIVTAHGRLRHFRTQWAVRPGADGLPERAVGILIDDTETFEQSQRETALARRLEMATSAAGVAVWTVALATGEVHWDDQMQRLHGGPGLPVPARLDAYLDRYLHVDDRAAATEALRALLRRQTGLVDLDLRVLRPDGSVRRVASRTSIEHDDSGGTLCGVMLDVTERHAAELRLRDAAERVTLATRGAGIGTWETDLSAEFGWWDEQMFHLRGREPQAAPVGSDERLAWVHPDDREATAAEVRDAIAADRPSNSTFRVIWPDGSVHWLASRSVPVRDDSGRTVRRIGINWDITDARAAAEAQQEIRLAQLESQAKSRFLARMSHELRTPLNAVLGFAQLLLADGPGQDEAMVRRRAEHIHAAGRHLLSLINDVLDLSSLESGERPLKRTPVPLRPLVDSVLPLVETMAAQYRVELCTGALDVAVTADAMRLRQVLINLLSNAIKYNRLDGRVLVEARAAGGRVSLRVEDNGRGMTPEQLQQVFEPFNRLGVETEGIDGTGIGLAIVRASMERMGGRIEVDSEAGRGSCFTLVLDEAAPPEGDDPDSAFTPLDFSAPDEAPAQRLLYIEDNPVNLLIVSELVSRRPRLHFDAAPDGASGVARARATQPSLILIDMQLPDFDGHEVLRRLRADPLTAGIRCIALSANAMPDDIQKALAEGFDDYWTKPLDFKRFMAALDAHFGAQAV